MQHQTETAQPMPMVLELFGHQRIAGHVSEWNFAGTSFVRVDVPQCGDIPGFTRMFHPNAVYCFNPVDEQTMVDVASSLRVKPLTPFDLSEIRRKMQASLPEEAFDPDNFDNENDDENPDDNGEEDEHKW